MLQVARQINAVTGLAEGAAALASQTSAFMKPPLADEEPGAKRRRLTTKTRPKMPRLPTLHWMQDVRHCMSLLGRPLHEFVSSDEALHSEKPPALLTICTDQESLQIAATNFMKWHANLFCEHVYDPQHRRSNDTTLGLAESGMLHRVSMNLCLFNLKFGPYLKGGWHTLIVEAADRVSKELCPNDAVLKHFFPSILEDLDEPFYNNSESRRKQFLIDLPTMPFVTSKGPKAATSRFNSVTQAALWLDRHWSSQAFLFTLTCLMQGWVTYADQLWQPDLVETPGGVVVLQGSVESSRTSTAAASSSTGATTKQKAKLQAKAELQKMRGKATNTFHAMTKYLNDPESKTYCRVLAYLQEPEAESSGLMLHRLRGEEATREQFAAWADWSFLTELKGMIGVLADQRKLSRMGFNMSLSVSGLNKDSIAIDNCLAWTVFKTMKSLLKFRCGSMLWHVWSLPGVTAGLLASSEANRQKCMVFLKKVYEATSAAANEGSLATKRLLFGQGSTSPAMKWFLHRLKKDEFGDVSPQVRQFLTDLWSSLLNSKAVEDLQKLQREHGVRSNPSKQVSKMEAWRVGSQHKLLPSYDRQEISASNFVLQPENFQEADLFAAPQRENSKASDQEKAFSQKLKQVTGQTSWPTFNPETQQETFANLALLIHIHDKLGDWQKVEQAYRASFLPEGHCILQGGCLYYVIRVYENAALCWPSTLYQTGIKMDMDIAELSWVFVFETESVQVIPVEPVSPVYMFDLCKKANAGVTLKGGSPVSLLDHHMTTGFAGLRESALRRYMSDLGIPENVTDPEVPEECSLAANLMLHVNPMLNEHEVVNKLLERECVVSACSLETEESLEEAVKDTVLSSEVDKVLMHVKAASAKKQEEQHEKLKKAAVRVFWKVKDAIPAARLKECKAKTGNPKKEKPSGTSKETEQKRVYDSLSADVDRALRENVPDKVKVYTDELNGRWKICWEKMSFRQKSFSWTAIGAAAAARLGVEQAWKWSNELTGVSMPAAIKAKMAKLV